MSFMFAGRIIGRRSLKRLGNVHKGYKFEQQQSSQIKVCQVWHNQIIKINFCYVSIKISGKFSQLKYKNISSILLIKIQNINFLFLLFRSIFKIILQIADNHFTDFLILNCFSFFFFQFEQKIAIKLYLYRRIYCYINSSKQLVIRYFFSIFLISNQLYFYFLMENKFILLSLLGITLVFLNLSNIDFWNKSTTLEKDFELWEQQFSIIQYKKISEVERLYRIKVFELNIAQINNHNSKLGKTYKLGTNQFLAITKQQFKALYLGKYEANQNYKQSLQNEQVQGLVIDWVFQKAVTTVKNQGKCQANHVFAAIGAMQGISAIFGNKLQQYSGQQIIDCSWIYGNKKCDGGQISFVYNYLQIFNNILQSQYPWTGIPGNCEAAESNKRLKSYEIVNDCANMAIALRSRPLSVVVDGQNMQFYKQGIFNNCQTNLSLPLLLVGLLDPYFTLKNSWGTTWGQNGYIRISRGNTCGVCMLASYPVPK